MPSRAFLFPGQGSQAPGMGKELYESYDEFRRVFELGSRVTGRELAALCFDADEGELARTENAQLAIFAVSMGVFSVLGRTPEAAAGFSLGECSALCAAGVIGLEDGFLLVNERARLMQAACDAGGGAMSAILGLEDETVARLAGGTGAMPVNFNCPGQTVIAGSPDGVAALEKLCLENGAKRAARLSLSGAFHTPAMQSAAEALSQFARGFKVSPPAFPVYCNAAGLPLKPDFCLPDHLARQMTHPVLWRQSLENMAKDGISAFAEIGHGQALSGFTRRTLKEAPVFRCDTAQTLEAAREALT